MRWSPRAVNRRGTGLLGVIWLRAGTNEKEAHKAVIVQFNQLRSAADELHTQGNWEAGCEVSTTRKQRRAHYEQREVVVLRDLSWCPNRGDVGTAKRHLLAPRDDAPAPQHGSSRPGNALLPPQQSEYRRAGPPHPQPLVGRECVPSSAGYHLSRRPLPSVQ